MVRRSLAGSVIGGIRETQEMFDFCSKYNISSDIEVTPIQAVNEAYERVVKRQNLQQNSRSHLPILVILDT